MSYYNQPDHELLDRRNAQARGFLLRLARATTSGLDAIPARSVIPAEAAVPDTTDPALARWLALARGRDLPLPDSEPLALAPAEGVDDGEMRLPLIWRAHYVAAVFAGATARSLDRLADRGFEVIAFPAAESEDLADAWAEPFRRLAAALGRGT